MKVGWFFNMEIHWIFIFEETKN